MPEQDISPAAQADRTLKGFSFLISAIRLGADARRLLEAFLSSEEIALLDQSLENMTKLKGLDAFESLTSTTIPQREVKPAGRRRNLPKKDRLLDIVNVDTEDVETARRIISFWPTSDPKDGRPINPDPRMLVTRLVEIRKRQPRFTLAILERAGRAYCSTRRDRFKAPQYFFSLTPEDGSDKPPFYPYALPEAHKAEAQSHANHASPLGLQ